MQIEIRPQRVTDAKRFFEILSNPNIKHFSNPETLEEEIEFLKKNSVKRRKNLEHNFAILVDKKIAGGCGIKVDQHRPHIAEVGYFLAEEYWGKGIAVKATKILMKKFEFKRYQLIADPRNKQSIRVAEKLGFRKEGLMKKYYLKKDGKLLDMELWAKT